MSLNFKKYNCDATRAGPFLPYSELYCDTSNGNVDITVVNACGREGKSRQQLDGNHLPMVDRILGEASPSV